ncbi:MAG: chemoreceptor glutamine deamidase CheD [Alphaproteobacteria bacterium]|nr:MAG: chemoreceptor glutamine deamidase CheD [Alphaproteobacteria bacterium]
MSLVTTIERRAPRDKQPIFVSRYFDSQIDGMAVTVLPAQHAISASPDEVLVTVLGSCVAACIHDPVMNLGGMNHFMLPGEAMSNWSDANREMRYGHTAMEKLINDLLSRGCRKERFAIKLFGGASVIQSPIPVGEQNIIFVRRYLRDEGLSIMAEDLGGFHARRIYFRASAGKVDRLLLKRQEDETIFTNELSLRQTLRQADMSGSVELF